MKIVLVVAVAENGVIGHRGQLPWRLPTDLKRFRRVTLGKPVIMGRKTYESIGKPLDGRDNIVITSRSSFREPGVHVARSLDQALTLARTLAGCRGTDECAVIGGAEVFRAALPLADRVHLTLVHANPPGDVVLDEFDRRLWREAEREPMQRGHGDEFDADFLVLERSP